MLCSGRYRLKRTTAPVLRYLVYKSPDLTVFGGKEGSPINLWRRMRLQAACCRVKPRLCLRVEMINSHWVCKDHFPEAVFQFIWTFQKAKDLTADRHRARRLWTHLSRVFFPPRDHCLQRLGENKGSDQQKSAVAPLFPHLACPVTHAHAQIYDAYNHSDVCVPSKYTHTSNHQRASPVESHIRPACLKKIIMKFSKRELNISYLRGEGDVKVKHYTRPWLTIGAGQC